MSPPKQKPIAAIVYPYIPHYRLAVFRALSREENRFEYHFFAGQNTIDSSIKSTTKSSEINLHHTPIKTYAGLTLQTGIIKICANKRVKNIVFLGDPHFVLTWIYALFFRLLGKRVWFWTHGWLRHETGVKGLIRRTFYKLGNGLLLYGNRAQTIGASAGFPTDRLKVIYNSLDYDAQKSVRESISGSITNESGADVYFACIARLTSICKLDLAIRALKLMQTAGTRRPYLVLIGDGPARAELEALAVELEVDVRFLGAIYDEKTIGPVLFNARAVVSPGKIGLTAMHSLAYGTPIITHGNLDLQMPEAEALIPDKTGDFFKPDDVQDLSRVLTKWVQRPRTVQERQDCIHEIESKYCPEVQRRLIEAALST